MKIAPSICAAAYSTAVRSSADMTDGGPSKGTSSKGEDNLKTYVTVEEYSRSRVFVTYWELFLKL